jgi:D-glycero-D-manno-heptose 1,7-bisphosphate phosphatase
VSGAEAVFVDRDGVINELVPDPVTGAPESPLRVEDVRLIDGAADALARLAEARWLIVGVSNQPAAAKGTVDLSQLSAVQDRVLALLDDAAGVRFAGFRICLHHPDAIVEELRGPCDCRKPAPGMLVGVAAELSIDLAASWMVGDTDDDVTAGHAAGCATILVEHPGSAHKRSGSSSPDHVVPDLAHAADFIIGSRG